MYSEKKGYTEGVKYYYKVIKGNRAVRNSDFYSILKKFGAALKDFEENESTTALVDMTNIFPEFFVDGHLPDLFVSEKLTIAFDCISEYMMHLGELYHLDYYA
jgi:hypothetical protein